MVASTCNPGTTYDTVLSVFTGDWWVNDCGHLSCFDGNDDDKVHCRSNPLASTVVWDSDERTEYFILVHGYADEGDFELTVKNLAGRVTRFILVDADTNHDIRHLDLEYDLINLAVDGTSLAVRAEVDGNVKSVKFETNDSPALWVESFPPLHLSRRLH